MDDLLRLNKSILSTQDSSLHLVNEYASIIKFSAFSASQNNKPLWTPSPGKSIYLTGINIYSSFALSIAIKRGTSTFLVVQTTSALNSYSSNYPSPVLLNANEVITVSFTMILAGNASITLYGFEK